MGLTNSSTGRGAVDSELFIKKQTEEDLVIALAGNPNVGKSTLFNNLTGMHQHTGNWPGKTVTNAQGFCRHRDKNFVFVDIPGTYSLMAHSAEEEVARNFICFGDSDAVVVVCDATCLERNLNLVLQTLEITDHVVVCLNLMDEAKRKRIDIDIPLLSKKLGVPVIGTVARSKKSLSRLLDELQNIGNHNRDIFKVEYCDEIENAIKILMPSVHKKTEGKINTRWLCLKLLDPDPSLLREISSYFGSDLANDPEIKEAVKKALVLLKNCEIDSDKLKDKTVSALISNASKLCHGVVTRHGEQYSPSDRKIDNVLTGKKFAFPTMLLLLMVVFFITIEGANYPSAMLSELLFSFEKRLTLWFEALGAPTWLHGIIVLGMYRVLAWVVAVMLPPMAIFFPLFTLLEDVGYLPRIAYNLDRPFCRCKACGKQALTMCMGFGCNAAGIVGCRIIDSPRERLLAILTNSFVPCNGRFPALISIITMFFVGFSGGFGSSVLSALMLTAVIVLGIFVTFIVTRLLSDTLLKGTPSSFTLEMPPYRKPQIGKVIIRSIFDRTLFVLGRAVAVAAPAGMFLWVMANVTYGGDSLLAICARFLDPFAQLLGLDGIILIAFVLGFPANEIVIPIMIMAYSAEGALVESESLLQLKELFVANGWTEVTAVCVMLFSLMHWPCSTTLMTIKKETGSLKWTLLAALIPTLVGMTICFVVNAVSKLI